MALRHVSSAPKADDFIPLEEHQAQTPSTFFGGKPVLHAQQSGLTLLIQSSKVSAAPSFDKFTTTTSGDQAEDVLIKDVELWATSEDLILYQHNPSPTGVAVPYPSIALHATMKWKSTIDALLINVSLNDADSVNEDDDIQVLEVIVLPPNYSTIPEPACIKEIFSAMNTCADLHPDPNSSEAEGDDEVDMTAPGATGWITAENMDEYLDEDGNFRGGLQVMGGAALGPGAGTVRNREEGDEDHINGFNGVDGASHETKYYRTE